MAIAGSVERGSVRRRRIGAAAACLLALAALCAGTRAGLRRSATASVHAQAAVVPEVLYLEEEVAKLATIARVNGNIANEVGVDSRSKASASKDQAPSTSPALGTNRSGPSDDPIVAPAPAAEEHRANEPTSDVPAPRADPRSTTPDAAVPTETPGAKVDNPSATSPTTSPEHGKADPQGPALGRDRNTTTTTSPPITSSGAKNIDKADAL